jgi:hypothetical protein
MVDLAGREIRTFARKAVQVDHAATLTSIRQ